MIPFGHRIEPFVDSYLIAEKNNVIFRYTEPMNRGLALKYDQPWENPGSCVFSALEDEEGVKLYYRGFRKNTYEDLSDTNVDTCALAFSRDGLLFEYYPVNQVEYAGSNTNNLIAVRNTSRGELEVSLGDMNVFYDTNPDCKPDERYKFVSGRRDERGSHGIALFAFCSADGIHWRKMSDIPVVIKGELDTFPITFWDSHAKLYRCYSRYFDDHGTYSQCWAGGQYRAIQSCVSTDFIHWSEPVFNQYEEELEDHLYTCSVVPLPGAEHVKICMSMRFAASRQTTIPNPDGLYKGGTEGVSDAVFMSSRDGVKWDRTIQDAWISPSTYEHEWTQRNFIIGGGLIERGDDFLFYVNKNYMWNDESLWTYSVPRYRFMYLYADGSGGTVLTKPLYFQSDDIYLNYATSAYGSVVVTVLNDDGSIRFTSEEIFGNEFSHRVHVEGLKNTTGRLYLTLKEARVYAIGSDMA